MHRRIFTKSRILHKEFFLNGVIIILESSFISEFIKLFIPSDKTDLIGAFLTITIAFVLIIVNYFNKSDKNIQSYKATKQFSGLYCVDNIEKLKLSEDNGLINRQEEIEYLYSKIKIILPEKDKKQGLCLVGKSGCGKSTILYLFQKQYANKINIFNYSKKYDSITRHIVKDIGVNWENNIKNLNQKYVFIFDQFEQFFHKSEEKQMEIRKIIVKLSEKNIAIIFSIREEYLSRFIRIFNINDLGNNNFDGIEKHGVIGINKYLDKDSNNILNRRNTYLLFCLDDMEKNERNINNEKLSMKVQCIEAFGEKRGISYYNKFNDLTLIQQQIIFNVLANEKESSGFINFNENTEDFYLKRFYDVQLCSTGNFFIASRIMYLLSLGNSHHISFEKEDIMRILCIADIKYEKQTFNKVINKLQELQLIKHSVYNSDEVYEIAHDFIAKSFESYAKSEMLVDVRAAIDQYVTEFLKNISINEEIDKYRMKKSKRSNSIIMFWLSIILSIIFFAANYVCATNNDNLLVIKFVLTLCSLFYVFSFYYCITRFYSKKSIIIFLYLLSLLCGVLSIINLPYWLLYLGLGNFFVGISSLVIGVDKKISRIGKHIYISYGLKTVLMGILLIFLEIYLRNVINTTDTFILEMVSMGALLMYALYSHLNEEFIYVHLEAIFSKNSSQRTDV